ncbi:MAG: malto-oligosyltrehalose synthase [Dehalococcoidia bacterium]
MGEHIRETPVATYRLQLHRKFDFADAARILPYLQELGISHVYLSPVWAAASGSGHGYDVIDHSRVNPELGGMAGLYDFAQIAKQLGMGLIFDIVPNHVGISNHPWWRDVLRHGPQSPFAAYFDIAWSGQLQQVEPELVYPVLGQPFGLALEAGDLTVEYDGTEIVVRYYDRTFPVAPSGYREILGLPPSGSGGGRERDLVEILDHLSDADPAAATVLTGQLAELLLETPRLRAWVDEQLAGLRGEPGRPDTFDALERVLRRQHYRLAYWRVSTEEINYRRFFDINDLAAIRVEHEPVFAATHSLVRELVSAGIADGLRIDHVDGLYDPGGYLRQLRNLATTGTESAGIWVEKILARNEDIPADWPVEGTTGYDFLAIAGGLFVDQSAHQAFTAIYEDIAGSTLRFEDIAFAAKRRIAGRSFAGEVNVLALEFYREAQRDRLARDNTLGAFRDAVASLLAVLPIYRTYLEHDRPMEGDSAVIEPAAAEAMRRDPNVTPEAMAFVVKVLLVETSDESDAASRWVHRRRRFQQLSGPVMAKGVEDTAFYRYHRLICCNEVGDDPGHFGISVDEAHSWFGERATRWPLAMSATTTHDTKRSEDARMRLAALTAMPREWHAAVRAWRRTNQRHIATAHGTPAPDANVEYYLYQSLVASWEGMPGRDYVERIVTHMRKAAREGKLRTSWTAVDIEYEAALEASIRTILDRRTSAAFLRRLDDFVRRLEPVARLHSLALVALKTTAPGVPDFYQGSELALHTLTDPDNRGPVNYGVCQETLRSIQAERPGPVEVQAKTWMTWRLLELRHRWPALFAGGSYKAVEIDGEGATSLFAYERSADGAKCITVVVLRPATVTGSDGSILPGVLEETWIDLGDGLWADWLGGAEIHTGRVRAVDLLTNFPAAVLISERAEEM